MHHWTLVLGLAANDATLLSPALPASVITVGTSRTSVMQAPVHPVLLATYLFLSCAP